MEYNWIKKIGSGGATQAVTTSEIKASNIINLKTGDVLNGGK